MFDQYIGLRREGRSRPVGLDSDHHEGRNTIERSVGSLRSCVGAAVCGFLPIAPMRRPLEAQREHGTAVAPSAIDLHLSQIDCAVEVGPTQVDIAHIYA